MASKCPNCSQEFRTKDLLTAHCNEKHVGSINAKVGGVELSIKPRPDGSFLCPCPYHLDANVYNSVEEIAHHLKFAVKWAHKKPPEHPCAVGHQLVDTTTLRQFGFAVNVDHCLLICLACCTAILPKNVGTHLRDAHKTPLPAKTAAALSSICQFFKVEKEKFPNMHKQLTLEAQPIHEVHGLSVHPGFGCTACVAAYRGPDSLVKHFRATHPDHRPEETWPSCTIQRLNGFENRYFRVRSKSPPPSTVDDLLAEVDRVLQEGQKRDPAKNLASVDKRNVSPWLRDTRWHELLSGHTISDLCARVVAPTVAEFPNLQATVYLFLESCVALIDVSTVLTLQTLNSPLPSQAITNHPFKRLNGETMKKYAGPIVNLLAMLLRAPYHPLPEDIQKHVEDLRASLPLAERECGLEAVFTLLANLWQRPWVPTQERRISDPTVIYVALSTLQPSGQFQEPKNVTNIIARIEYCMRLTFLKLIHEAPTLEYGIYSNQPWFIEKVESPFNSLRTLQHLATSIAYQTQSLPRVWWDDRKAYASMIYKGDRIQFDQIRSMLSALEEDMADLWEHHILLSTGVKVSYVDLHDDLSNREAGYSFIHDPRNDLFQDRRRLVKAVLSDPDQRVRFINSTTSQWNVHELRQWLSHYARFHLLLLLKSNLTGGSPGRITELTAMQLCNLVTYPLRNLVVFGRHVALLCTYMKTSANSGYDKLIPHSLDAFTSDLLVQDLAIARPFAEFAIRKCHPDSPEIHALFKNHIFINHTRLFTTDDVTTELKRSCIPHLGIEIGVNGWRHISTAFRRVLCPRFTHLLDDDPENESIDALQSGHTRQTENRIYGVSQDALAGASEDVLPLFLDASTDWQLQCSVVPGGLRLSYNEARMSRFEDLVGAGVISPPTGRGKSLQEVLEARLNELVALLLARIANLEDMLRASGAPAHPGPLTPPVIDNSSRPSWTPSTPQSTHVARALAPVHVPAVIPFSIPRLHPSSKATETRPLESGKTIGVRHSPFAISAPARDTATSAFPSSTARGTSSPGSSEHGPNSYAELALQHLKRLVGDPDAQWKCPEQKLATVAMLELRQDVIAVMATSSGKSMIAILPSLVEHNKITVLILPLRALMLDFSTKLRRMNVPFEVYEPSRPLQGSFNLILVSADYAKTDGWRQSIARINQKRPVVRQIFDEAHIPPTAEHYRAALEQMSDIRCSFPCQIGLLSATITPLLEKRLIKDYCMNDVLVLRTCTNRPELQYEWLPRTSSEELPSLVRQQVAQLVKTPKDRGLIFVPTKVIGEAIAEELGYPFFYSTPDVEEQKGIYGSWVQGTTPTIVCTSAFGTGNDNPHVRLVIHAGTPYELIEFIQEVSRAGRDHQPATCVLLPTVTRNVPEDLAESEDFSGRRPMADLLKGDEICIRAAVTYYIDGVSVYCSQSPDNMVCSRCRSRKESASRPSPFEASTEQAKHQRMERLKLASDYIANFKRQLCRFENMCAFCLCFKKGLSGHELVHCPSIKEHSGPDAPGHFFSWRRKLKYNTDYHTGICYTCHVPQGKHDALHDTFRRGKLACEYPDIIAPAVYASLLQPKERAHLAATFGQTWNTPSDAVPWLNSKPVEGHASNISALFLRLMEDKK